MDYKAQDFSNVGITKINIECGLGFANKDEWKTKFIIDFEQFIPHRDNPNPTHVIGNSLTVSNLKHRIIEAETLDSAITKMIAVAKMFILENYPANNPSIEEK